MGRAQNEERRGLMVEPYRIPIFKVQTKEDIPAGELEQGQFMKAG